MLWRLDVVEGAEQLAQAECKDCVFEPSSPKYLPHS